jgi:pyrimidine operon attenuation protein/uracil phosphoribosyltransferase
MEQVILNQEQIERKSLRIAYQILESHVDEKKIILIGIESNGFLFAKKLAEILSEISNKHIVLGALKMDKKNPLTEPICDLDIKDIENQSLVLVDDVLQSGTTLMYGVKFFLQVSLKQFKTAVLVDRNHKRFPVKADFKGLSLSTSTQSKVEVVFEYPKAKALLVE